MLDRCTVLGILRPEPKILICCSYASLWKIPSLSYAPSSVETA